MASITGALFAAAGDGGERPALICDDRTLSHAALRARIEALARALQSAGVRSGDRVAVLLPNCAEFVEAFFGITAIGAIVVPLNTRLHPGEHAGLLADCSPVLMIAASEYRASAEHVAQRVPSVRSFVTVGPGGEDAAFPAYASWVGAHAGPMPQAEISSGSPAALLYTSGTTAQPKGVVLTHGNYLADFRHVAAEAGIGPDGVNLQLSPLYHAACVHTLVHLVAGGSSVLMRRFDPAEVLERIERHRVTYLFAVPTMLYELLDHPGIRRHDIGSLRTVSYGAAAISGARLEQAQRVFGAKLLHAYGLTETTSHSSVLRADEHRIAPGSIGRGIDDVQLRVVDELGRDLGPGEVGELLVKGPNVMAGYWNRPEETAHTLRGGWLHTGDLARRDERGFLYIVDRKKDMVISGGVNLYPRESEDVLARHPAVADVAVFGVPDERWGEVLVAAVVPRKGAGIDAETLLAFARTQLGSFKLPKRVHFVDELPKTASGKVRKADLRSRFQGVRAS